MNEENIIEVEAEKASTVSPVLVLPGHIFFVDRIEIPSALDSSEIDDFAELSVEGLAPFPIEQLYWGFIYSESDGHILLYAAYKERVKALGHKELDNYAWVLPDFATTFGAYFPDATTLQLESEDGISRIFFAAGSALPSKVISTWANSELPASEEAPKPFCVHLESAELNEQGLPIFTFSARDDRNEDTAGNWQKLSPGQNELWRADVRDTEFKKAERNTRKLSSWVTRATVYAAFFVVFLVLLEGALYFGSFWLQSQSTQIAEQAPEVRRIEDKQSLMNKLDQVAQNELRPIAILYALNNIRPAGIYFTSTVAEGQNRIIIEGYADTVTELNTYLDALKATGNFVKVDSKQATKKGVTTFIAIFDYIHIKSEDKSSEGQIG